LPAGFVELTDQEGRRPGADRIIHQRRHGHHQVDSRRQRPGKSLVADVRDGGRRRRREIAGGPARRFLDNEDQEAPGQTWQTDQHKHHAPGRQMRQGRRGE